MTLATIGHALCSLGAVMAGSGIHSQLSDLEFLPSKWKAVYIYFGYGSMFSGLLLKGVGHTILLLDSCFEKPDSPTSVSINSATFKTMPD